MITWYCPDCPFSVGSRSGLTVRDAKNEHEKTCVAQSTGHQLFKGGNTMSKFLEDRRDWKKDMIMADFDEDKISKHEAEERLQAVDEQYDRSKRWRSWNDA